MQILARHLLARFLRSFVAILVILLLAVLVGDALLDLGDLLEQQRSVGLRSALAALLLQAPARYLPILFPMAAFAAAYATLGFAARWMELVAMQAGGISPLRVVLPLLGASAALAATSLFLNETVVLRAARSLERYDAGDGGDFALRRGSFWHHSGDVIYDVRDSDPGTRTLQDVLVLELDRGGRLRRSIEAPRAEIESRSRWHLRDVVVRRFDLADATAAPATEHRSELVIEVAVKSDKVLLDERASTFSLADLQDAIGARTRDGHDTRRFRALLHERLTEPVSVLLFAWLAIPLGLRVESRRSLAGPALEGVLVIVLFFFLRHFGATLAAQGVAPASATPWTILAVFAAWGALRLRQAPR